MNVINFQDLIGVVMKKLRKEHGFNQDEISDRVGMHKTTYLATEKGTRPLTLPELFSLADIYQMRPSTIVAMIQMSPEETERTRALQAEINALLRDNAILKEKISKGV